VLETIVANKCEVDEHETVLDKLINNKLNLEFDYYILVSIYT
jgi:hypothetical protein